MNLVLHLMLIYYLFSFHWPHTAAADIDAANNFHDTTLLLIANLLKKIERSLFLILTTVPSPPMFYGKYYFYVFLHF